MSLSISTREVGDVRILDCEGRITSGDSCGLLRDTVKNCLIEGKRKLLLNLEGVTFMDAPGLGELVSAYTTTANQTGKLKLLNAQKKVWDFLQITKLYTVFETFTDEDAAIASFGT